MLKQKRIVVVLVVLVIGLIVTSFTEKNAGCGVAQADSIAKNENVKDSRTLKDSEIEEAYYPKDYCGYRYPVLPGTTEWPYGNHQRMIDVCQISNSIVEQMTTAELIQTVMMYPLLEDIYAYDDLDSGFEIVQMTFSGLSQLCMRSDRAQALYDWLSDHRELFLSESNKSGNVYFDFMQNRVKRSFILLANRKEFFTEEIINGVSVNEAINRIVTEASK